MKKLDYHAILTVHCLPTYDKKTLKRLSEWLLMLSEDLAKEPQEYDKLFRARLMK